MVEPAAGSPELQAGVVVRTAVVVADGRQEQVHTRAEVDRQVDRKVDKVGCSPSDAEENLRVVVQAE